MWRHTRCFLLLLFALARSHPPLSFLQLSLSRSWVRPPVATAIQITLHKPWPPQLATQQGAKKSIPRAGTTSVTTSNGAVAALWLDTAGQEGGPHFPSPTHAFGSFGLAGWADY